MRKAVVFIDVQNDFITGSLGSPAAQAVLPGIVAYAEKCLTEGYKMYATRDTHGGRYLETLEGRRLPVLHCIGGTDGWQIAEGLRELIAPGNIFNKPTFGSFDLLRTIALYDYKEIEVCGFCTDICVISNVLMLRAKFPNARIKILADLCVGTSPEAHEAALKVARSCQIDVGESGLKAVPAAGVEVGAQGPAEGV